MNLDRIGASYSVFTHGLYWWRDDRQSTSSGRRIREMRVEGRTVEDRMLEDRR